MKCTGVQVVSASPSGFAMAAIATSKSPDETILRQSPVTSLPSLDSRDGGSDYAIDDEVVLFDDEAA